MSPRTRRGGLPPWRRSRVLGVALAVLAIAAALWSLALFHAPADGGSLDARVNAVGATVRCPICPEPIPLDDVQNTQALQMRMFIRTELQVGKSEEQVRQDLVARYGTDILLAPPPQGFNLLIWIVPLLGVVACGAAILLAVQRWAGGSSAREQFAPSAAPLNPEQRRYEEMLDRELAARE